MGKIKCLPEQISRQIAAGEVVERPASVIKELIENSLDAGANVLKISIADGGIGAMEVSDNGTGMAQDDLRLSYRNFSTSKISSPEDLFRISTYGFRGEALASVSSVSKMTITSSSNNNGEGWSINAVKAANPQIVPAPHERGTTVKVENLFYNTPARRKFLRSNAAEKKKIFDTILTYAMLCPDIEFHYKDDGRHVLDILPADNWKARISAVIGSTSMKHMVALESGDSNIRIEGYTSLPALTRANRSNQFCYINGRMVREKTIMHALNEAYRRINPPKRFPITVLKIQMPSGEVDVNVHPSKLEVRLHNPGLVHSAVTKSVRAALSSNSESSFDVSYDHEAKHHSTPGKDNLDISTPELFSGPNANDAGESRPDDNIISIQSRIKNVYVDFMTKQLPPKNVSSQLSLRSDQSIEGTALDVGELKNKHLAETGLFWQFNKSFIFIQVHGGLVIIDQHAAHERIIFDTSRQNIEKSISVSQQILFPIHLELSLSELDVFRSSRGIFERLGFVIEPFGGKSILVRGYPQGLKNWEEGRLLIQIFDDIVHNRVPGKDHGDSILASFACRSAVKAGQKLSSAEMRLLADQLFAVDHPYSCPHGRPTIQRISLKQVENWFQR